MEWTDIKGFEGLYKISRHGEVYSYRKNTILKPSATSTGYYQLVLYGKGYHKRIKIHRVVAQHFIPNPLNYPCINHKDFNRINNYVDNLEWCTNRQNIQHAARHGRMNHQGERNSRSKLTVKDVLHIRGLNRLKKLTNREHIELGNKYGVHRATILNLVKRDTWTHLP